MVSIALFGNHFCNRDSINYPISGQVWCNFRGFIGPWKRTVSEIFQWVCFRVLPQGKKGFTFFSSKQNFSYAISRWFIVMITKDLLFFKNPMKVTLNSLTTHMRPEGRIFCAVDFYKIISLVLISTLRLTNSATFERVTKF